MEKADFESVMKSLNQAAEIAAGQRVAARVSQHEIPDVRTVRKQLNLRRKDFAELLGISPRTLESWEQGKRRPGGAAGVLLRIANKTQALFVKCFNLTPRATPQNRASPLQIAQGVFRVSRASF